MRLFFAVFLNVSIVSPFHFSSILQKNRYSKTPQRPPLTFFGAMRLTGDQKIFRKKFKKNSGTVEENTLNFEVLLLFLSFRYGADLGRSRLVFSNGRIISSIVPKFGRSFNKIQMKYKIFEIFDALLYIDYSRTLSVE